MVANAFDCLRSFVLSVFLIAAFALPAFAGPFEDAVAKFANDEFSDTEEAVGAIATSGNPLAFPIISALQEGRLSADPDTKNVYATQTDGKIIDAAPVAAWTSCRTMPPRCASTTACAGPSRPRSVA